MGKVVYSFAVSLDGYIEDPNHSIDWVIVDEEYHRHANEQARRQDAFLHGRRMYELMAAFWPTSEALSSDVDYVADFARIWTAKPKIVFSRSLDKVDWNSRLVRDDVPEEVRKLKRDSPGELGVGGADLASTLIRHGLVDEYELYVNPVLLGGGTPMFPSLNDRVRLRLVERQTFASGVVYLRYQAEGKEPR